MDYESIIARMISRRLLYLIQQRLRQFPAVGLLGPRQVGKTTLARMIQQSTNDGPKPEYLDLENPVDLAKLEDPGAYLRSRGRRLLILDEIQRSPGLFQVLRGIIDERIQQGDAPGQFLLLGSASIDLLKQSSESLAGRIAYEELPPLDITEATNHDDLWVRGGFPASLLADSDEQSSTWRENFISTYLERDIPQLGPRVPAETLRHFWTMLAHRQASIHNGAELARSLGVAGKTIARYLDLLVDLLLIRRLPPHHANIGKRLVKSPKIYLRDSGLVHTLLRIEDESSLLGHPIVGASWEGFVIENLIRLSPPRTRASFMRTSAGAEIDLLLELPNNQTWGIEVKRSSSPQISKGFHIAKADLNLDHAFVVYPGKERIPKPGGIEAMGLTEMSEMLMDLHR
mgnify:FL=1|jgi:uncharacterized protein